MGRCGCSCTLSWVVTLRGTAPGLVCCHQTHGLDGRPRHHGAPGWFPPGHHLVRVLSPLSCHPGQRLLKLRRQREAGLGEEGELQPGWKDARGRGGARRGGTWMEGCKGEGARVKLKHGRKRSIFVQSEECGTIGQQPAPDCQWAGERRTPTCV
jgi:hypothetical protein